MDRPRLLVIVRAGRRSIHRSYTYLCSRLADFLISVYDDSDWRGEDAKFFHAAPGGKFQGLRRLFSENPRLIEAYDYFWLFEDDLYLPTTSLESVLSFLTRFDVALASPSLSAQSYFAWAICMRNENMILRGTDFVEIMAPIMSRAFLEACLPHFDLNYSGYGYEWLWRKLLRSQNRFALIFDQAPIVHTRPLGRGSLDNNKPDNFTSFADDLRGILSRFDLKSEDTFKNLFGVAAKRPQEVLFGQDLVNEMLSGYRSLLDLDHRKATFCIEQLLKANRPEMTGPEAAGLAGFEALRAAIG